MFALIDCNNFYASCERLFRPDLPQYSNTTGFKLIAPSDDLRQLAYCAKQCLKQLFKEGIYYKKVGVTLDGLTPKMPKQSDLFNQKSHAEFEQCEHLMRVVEDINGRFGSSTLRLAAEGYSKPWAMKRSMKSPSYTTRWNELPTVYAR